MGYIYSLLYAVPWLGAAIGMLIFAFQIWMIVDCVRNGNEFYWIWIILFLGPIGALIYFFVCKYRSTGIERSFSKRRIQQRQIEELQQKIYHLDKAHHFAELGDIYRQQKKWPQAQKAYESALERDDGLFDARAHLGYVLQAQGHAQDAWKFLGPAMQQKPQFESGELVWQCARCQVALGELAQGRQLYERLLTSHSYLEAQYEYAELLDSLGDTAGCIATARQLVHDAQHAPRFHQRASRPWKKKAQRLLRAKGGVA